MLYQIYKRALKAGGAHMPVAKYAKVFGNDTALRRNVLRACGDIRFAAAIAAGTVGDHRVFEALAKMGGVASHIVLEVEAKLGRKLGRAKAHQLCVAYLRIVAARTSSPDQGTKVIHLQRAAANNTLSPQLVPHLVSPTRRRL